MKLNMKPVGLILLITLITTFLVLAGCGGGGGSGSSSSDSAPADTGTVALSLTDGPTDDYKHIYLYITQVSLLPANGGDPVVIFKSKDPDGYRVDLLDLREKDDAFLLSVKKKVPAGQYAKIRLEVAEIEAEGYGSEEDEYRGPVECDSVNTDIYIKLPSDKIDLNPQGPFWVKKGETIAIKLDVDAKKSLLHKAGKSGKCIFSPTVFVDIETLRQGERRCPQILAGEMETLIEDSDGNVDGFEMTLKETWYSKNKDHYQSRGEVDVLFSDDPDDPTTIFDENGESIDPEDLKFEDLPQMVLVRGRLNRRGEVLASLVVLGGVQVFKGTVIDLDSDQNQFTIELSNGSGSPVIDYDEDTLILTNCNTEGSDIPLGSKVRVYGKFVDPENGDDRTNTIQAIVVVVKDQDISWTLVEMNAVSGGYDLILEELGEENPIFLPDGAPVSLKGDGDLEADFLAELVNCNEEDPDDNLPRQVEIIFDDIEEDEAAELFVYQDELKAVVEDTIPEDNVIEYDSGKKILVNEDDVRIFRHIFVMDKCGNTKEVKCDFIHFEEISPGDEITAFGLEACPNTEAGIGEVNFYANMIVVKTEVYKSPGDCKDDDSDTEDDDSDTEDDDSDSDNGKPKKGKKKK